MSKKSNRFSPEVRECAARLVHDHRGEYAYLWAAIESIAPKIGCLPQTPHEWVPKLEIDTGLRDGVTSEGRDRIKALIEHDLLGRHAGGAGLKEN
jgi:transposase